MDEVALWEVYDPWCDQYLTSAAFCYSIVDVFFLNPQV